MSTNTPSTYTPSTYTPSTNTPSTNSPATLEPLPVNGLLLGTELTAGYAALNAVVGLRPRAGGIQLRTAHTGSGKSADLRTLGVALASYGSVIVGFHEESASLTAHLMGLTEGGRNRDLAKRVKLVALANSPAPLVEALYRAVEASERGHHLPVAILVDEAHRFADTISSPSGVSDQVGPFLHALATLRLAELAEFTGISYESVVGRPAPDLTGLGVAVVVATSQLLPAARGEDGFTCPHTTPTVHAIRGGSSLVSYADTVIGFQRRRPVGQSPRVSETGRRCLPDTEGRALVLKNRYALAHPVIPLCFDTDPRGERGMWYDLHEHSALHAVHTSASINSRL